MLHQRPHHISNSLFKSIWKCFCRLCYDWLWSCSMSTRLNSIQLVVFALWLKCEWTFVRWCAVLKIMMNGNENSLLAWFWWQCNATIIYFSHHMTEHRSHRHWHRAAPRVAAAMEYPNVCQPHQQNRLGNEHMLRWWITSDWRTKIITFSSFFCTPFITVHFARPIFASPFASSTFNVTHKNNDACAFLFFSCVAIRLDFLVFHVNMFHVQITSDGHMILWNYR